MAQRAGRLSFARLRAQFTKEVLCTLRDPRSRMVVFMPPLLQLLVFAFAATLEVRNVDAVSYTHLRAHETVLDLVCRLLLEKKKK